MKRSNADKFASKIIEEYHEAVLELVTSIMSLDGFKTDGGSKGTHIASIDYMRRYKQIGEHEIRLMDSLRKKRIGVKYYGRRIDVDFITRREKDIKCVISKLKSIAMSKLE